MPIPPGIALDRIFRRITSTAGMRCLEENQDCSGPAINSHSIQNGVILEQLAEGDHIFAYRLTGPQDTPDFAPEGRNLATTFSGFCNYHDTVLFRGTDYTSLADIDPTSKLQQLGHFLRATSIELWKKRRSVIAARSLWLRDEPFTTACCSISFDPKTLNEPDDSNKHFYIGTRKGEEELREQYEALNAIRTSGNYHLIDSHIFIIETAAPFAVASGLSPTNDLLGQPLYVIEEVIDRMLPMPHMSLTIFPAGPRTVVLFSHRKKNRALFSRLFDQMNALSGADLEIAISQLVMVNCENTVYKPSRIQRLAPADRQTLLRCVLGSAMEEPPLTEVPKINLFRI